MTSEEVYAEAQAILATLEDLQKRALAIVDPLMSSELTLGFDTLSTVLSTTWGKAGIVTPAQVDSEARDALSVKFPEG